MDQIKRLENKSHAERIELHPLLMKAKEVDHNITNLKGGVFEQKGHNAAWT